MIALVWITLVVSVVWVVWMIWRPKNNFHIFDENFIIGEVLPFYPKGTFSIDSAKFLKCERCGIKDSTVKTYCQKNLYIEDTMDVLTWCSECKKENNKYWTEMW